MLMEGAEVTATVTVPVLDAKPAASTFTSYSPGGSDSTLKSPTLLLFTVRVSEKLLADTVTVAAAIRAPVTSDTVPTSAPSGLCAWAKKQSVRIRARRLTRTFIGETLLNQVDVRRH